MVFKERFLSVTIKLSAQLKSIINGFRVGELTEQQNNAEYRMNNKNNHKYTFQ